MLVAEGNFSQVMSMEQDQSNPAFTDGYDSGRDGAPRTDNPHKANSAEAEQWLHGWDEGLAKRDAVMPGRSNLLQPAAGGSVMEQATSQTTEGEPTEPGEKGELAAIQGEPHAANPYPADSREAEEWLDGHDFATSTNENGILPIRQEPIAGEEVPSQAVKVPAGSAIAQ